MTIAKSTDDLNIIAKLNKEPNDVGGLTYQQLQAKFDEGPLALQAYVNGLVDILNSTTAGSSGAENIGSATIEGISGSNVRAQIVSLLSVAQEAQAGTILDDSVADVKLSNAAGQVKARLNVVETDKIYQTAGGTANAITLSITADLVDGYPFTFIAAANNNGAATTINDKNLYKPGGTTAPTLIAGKAYTIWYDLSGDNFFVKATAEGDAVAANVLAGKTFSNSIDTGIVGTLPDITANFVAGDLIVATSPLETGIDGINAYVKAKEIKVLKAGTIRVKFDLRGSRNDFTHYGRIYKNGVAVGIERSRASSSYATYTEDITVAANDLIQIYVKSLTYIVYVQNFYICDSVGNGQALTNL